MTLGNSALKPPLDTALREKLSAAMRQSGKSRAQIAYELSRITDQKITLQQLNEWAAPTGKRCFRPFLTVPFCEIVGNDLVQRFFMSQRHLDIFRLGEIALESDGLIGTYGPKRVRSRRTRKA